MLGVASGCSVPSERDRPTPQGSFSCLVYPSGFVTPKSCGFVGRAGHRSVGSEERTSAVPCEAADDDVQVPSKGFVLHIKVSSCDGALPLLLLRGEVCVC